MTLTKLISSYPLHRAVVAGLTFAAVTIAARLLPASDFATLATAAFMAKFLHVFNLGATNGYFVSLYSGKGEISLSAKGTERIYLYFFLLQLIVLGLLVLGVAAWRFPQYLLGVSAFILIAPIFAVEPYLRSRQNFSFSLMPDLLLSAALLMVVGIHLANFTTVETAWPYLAVIASLTPLTLVLAMRKHMPSRGESGPSWRNYVQILSLGTPVYMGSLLFLLASSMDRLILPLHGTTDEVALYFLGYQLSVGSMIFLTAINFVNTVKLGEVRKDQDEISTHFILRKLFIASMVGLLSFIALVAGAIIMEKYYLPSSFAGLTAVVLFLGFALASFFISTAITPIVAYYQRQLPLTLAMALCAAALLANNFYALQNGRGALWLAKGYALTFFVYAMFAIGFTFLTIRQHPREIAPTPK